MLFVSIGAAMTAGRCHGLIAPRHPPGCNRFKAQRDWQKVTTKLGSLRDVHLAAISHFNVIRTFGLSRNSLDSVAPTENMMFKVAI
jgi:hypothetical protein